jgi:hypothetical protein
MEMHILRDSRTGLEHNTSIKIQFKEIVMLWTSSNLLNATPERGL